MTRKRTSPDPLPPPVVPAAEFRVVPIDQVVTSPLNPRHRGRGNADADLHELVASIRAHGILEPIVVRNAAHFRFADREGAYEVVAGNRRRRAAGLAGLTEVPVTIRQVSDAQLLEIALAENVHRKSMHPLDEADALAKLQQLDASLNDLDVLASKVGRSVSYVRSKLKLLRLTPIVIEALEAGAIHEAHAERIARLSPDQHDRALAACFSSLLVEFDGVGNPVAGLIDGRDWTALAPALRSLREFDEWLRVNGKADVAAPEVQQQLRELVTQDLAAQEPGIVGDEEDTDPDGMNIDDALEEATASLLQLSTQTDDWKFSRAVAKQLGVVHVSDWREITREKDRCEHVQRGAVVHPEGQLRIVDCCTAKRKCAKHWPEHAPAAHVSRAQAKQRETAERLAREERHRKDEAARRAWDALLPTAQAALGAIVQRKPIDIVDVIADRYGTSRVKEIASRYGVVLSTRSAGTVMALIQVSSHSREVFESHARQYLGVTAKQLRAELARLTKATAAKTKKPAKAKAKKAKAAA